MMSPDDPRHGTEAGFEQHARDGDDPCDACHDAKLKAHRRRRGRRAQGFVYTMPADMALHRIQQWITRGANTEDIARHTGLDASVVYMIVRGGPERPIYARTWDAIMSAPTRGLLTSLGAIRRVQALTARGYSMPVIVRETGLNRSTILDIRSASPDRVVAIRVRESIASAYRRLEMQTPTASTRQERAGITRARNFAEREGWPVPLAWNDIDDATEQPRDWEYVPTDRAEHLAELDAHGAGITQVCQALGIRRDSVERWCERHGLRAMYVRFMERETPIVEHRNQWSA